MALACVATSVATSVAYPKGYATRGKRVVNTQGVNHPAVKQLILLNSRGSVAS